MKIKLNKGIDVSKIFSDESIYSVASFSAFRLDREIGDKLQVESNEEIIQKLSFDQDILLGDIFIFDQDILVGDIFMFEEQLQRPLIFLSDLFMEYHEISNKNRKNHGILSSLSEAQIDVMISITSAFFARALEEKSPLIKAKASTVPFQCVEDYENCIKNNSSKAMCSAALVICVLQCIIPFAKGASGSSNSDEE